MANNFVAIQNNQASDKFLLVRIEPARCLNTLLTLDSGSIYKCPFTFSLSKIEVNGVMYTEVSGTPIANQYSFIDNELKIFLPGAPSGSVVIIAYYFIFYTSSQFRVVGKDPENPLVDLKEWEPRITTPPSIVQDIKNVLNGVLSISSSNLTIANNEDYFEQFISDNDSFYNKKILIWHCLDNTDNIKKIFSGKITAIKTSRTAVTFDINDDLASLLTPATMGDDELYFTNDHFINVDSNKEGFPIRYIFGTSSRYKTIADPLTTVAEAQRLDPDFMNEAVCTDFTNDIGVTVNRDFGLCRVGANGFESFSFTPSAVLQLADSTRLTGSSAQISKFTIGDTFYTSGSGEYYGRVVYVDRVSNYLFTTKMASFILTDTIQSNNCPSIVIKNLTDTYYPIYKRDYVATVSTLGSGNKLLEIEFMNNFEATLSMPDLNPQIMVVAYKVKPKHSDQLHATVLNEILTKAGLSVNSASIAAMNAAFAENCAFSIPFFDEPDYNEYYKYIEILLQSTLGFIYLNNSFEIQYSLFTAPDSSSEITEADIIKDSYSIDIDYSDLVTTIIAYNPHFSSSEGVPTASATTENSVAKYLHGTDKTIRFRHVLEDFTAKILDHINLRSERYAEYVFATKQLNYLSEIGNDYLLSGLGLPNQAASRAVKILSLSKSSNKTNIRASDLLNI